MTIKNSNSKTTSERASEASKRKEGRRRTDRNREKGWAKNVQESERAGNAPAPPQHRLLDGEVISGRVEADSLIQSERIGGGRGEDNGLGSGRLTSKGGRKERRKKSKTPNERREKLACACGSDKKTQLHEGRRVSGRTEVGGGGSVIPPSPPSIRHQQ